jgi:hypothetical protein
MLPRNVVLRQTRARGRIKERQRMIVPNTEAMVLLDTGDRIYGYTVVNPDPANAIYIDGDCNKLNQAGQKGTLATSDSGIAIAANGGSWTVMLFTGKLYAIAAVAPVNLKTYFWWTGLTAGQPLPGAGIS